MDVNINLHSLLMIQLLNGSKQSLTAALGTLKIFGSLSGSTINVNKTKIIWIGNKINSAQKMDINENLEWGTTNSIFCVSTIQ